MNESPMLTGAIAKISTQSAGGYKIGIDAPENMKEVVRQLLGTENKKVYRITFEEAGDLEAKPRLKPGPKPKGAEEE